MIAATEAGPAAFSQGKNNWPHSLIPAAAPPTHFVTKVTLTRLTPVSPQEGDTWNQARGRWGQEAAHQEAAERLYAIHEGGAAQSGRHVQSEGELVHQPDPRTEGTAPGGGALFLV